MKKLNIIIATGMAAFMMQACHNAGTSTTASTDTTVTDVAKTDSTAMTAVPDTGDATFAMKAAAGGMTEITLSKLALQKSSNSKIKDFANMMVADHTAAGDKLAAIAKTKNITLPTSPDADQQTVIDNMSKKSGSDFDKAYVNRMISDHAATVNMFQGAQSTVKDADLKSFIDNTLPTIQKHLDAINTIKSGM